MESKDRDLTEANMGMFLQLKKVDLSNQSNLNMEMQSNDFLGLASLNNFRNNLSL
jgi:hypothetical protein